MVSVLKYPPVVLLETERVLPSLTNLPTEQLDSTPKLPNVLVEDPISRISATEGVASHDEARREQGVSKARARREQGEPFRISVELADWK